MTLIINGQTFGLNKTIIHKADGSEIDGSNGSVLKAADDCFSWKTKSDEKTYKSGQRKAKGKVWVHNFPFYANIGSETENFKKKIAEVGKKIMLVLFILHLAELCMTENVKIPAISQ